MKKKYVKRNKREKKYFYSVMKCVDEHYYSYNRANWLK